MEMKKYLGIKAYPIFVRRILMHSLESIRATRDMRRLKKKIPELQNFDKLANKSCQELQPYYKEYTSRVTDEAHTISLELSVFLTVVCNIFKPKSILDLGSGFSSVVFRLYMLNATPKPVIWSVDDSPEWLGKTRVFLAGHSIPTENLTSWRSFVERNDSTFELILHDLSNNWQVRKETLREVLRLAHPGGRILLDDMHEPDYRSYAKLVLNESRLAYYSLKSFTEDKFGRYSVLVTL